MLDPAIPPVSLLKGTASLTYGALAAYGGSSDQTMVVAGAVTGDRVFLGLPAAPTAGIVFQGFISAASTVSVRALNVTSASITPGAGTYTSCVLH